MEDKEDDFYQCCREDLLNADIIRFFLQEDQLTFQQEGKRKNVRFPFSKLLYQCVNDLAVVNNVVRNFTRASVKYLQNGKEISHMREQQWKQFLEFPQFKHITIAYLTLSQEQQQILKYKILALANLLFKMGMNMSKISLILLHKKITYPCLSVFSLSVAFLQFLQFSLFKIKSMKENQTQLTLSLFLRQLLKISIVKISYKRNNDEAKTLQISQQHFLTKHSSLPIRNVQYIELYQQQDLRGPYKGQTSYQHIFAYNMRDIGLKAPYSYDFYYFFKTHILNYLKEFNPDVILFIQDHKNDIHCIQPAARSLLLSQIIQNITPKIYYFRQFGAQDLILNRNAKSTGMDIQSEMIIPTQINIDAMKSVEKKQNQILAQIQNPKLSNNRVKEYIKNMRINILDDLLGVSLILTQRQKLDKVIQKYHLHNFDVNFIERFLNFQKKDVQRYENMPSQKQKKNLLKNLTVAVSRTEKLLNRLVSINKMSYGDQILQNNDNINRLLNKKSYYNGYYNIKNGIYETFITQSNQRFWFTNQDQICIKYLHNCVIVFISKQTSYCILKKGYLQTYFIGFEEQWPQQLHQTYSMKNLKQCSIVCTEQYIYRGFGVRVDQPTETSPIIFRYCIDSDKLFSKKWQVFTQECVPLNSMQQKRPTKIQNKIGGYSFYDEENKRVIMMGGYLNCSSEQKICKKVYTFVKDSKRVQKIGKSNNLIFGKIFNKQLFPFVFGMPFTFDNQKTIILNTNGYFQLALNNRKVFQSEFQTNNQIFSNGIVSQNQLDISSDSQQKVNLSKDEQKFCKEKLMDVIIQSTNYMNYYEGNWVIEMEGDKLWKISILPENNFKVVQIRQIRYQSFKAELIFASPVKKTAIKTQEQQKKN